MSIFLSGCKITKKNGFNYQVFAIIFTKKQKKSVFLAY